MSINLREFDIWVSIFQL